MNKRIIQMIIEIHKAVVKPKEESKIDELYAAMEG